MITGRAAQYHEPQAKLPPVTLSETDQKELVVVATAALADRYVLPAASNSIKGDLPRHHCPGRPASNECRRRPLAR